MSRRTTGSVDTVFRSFFGGLLIVGASILVHTQVRLDRERERAQDELDAALHEMSEFGESIEEWGSAPRSVIPDGSSLFGRVIDEEGTPVPGAGVTAVGFSEDPSLSDADFRAAVEREDERFQVPAVVEERWMVLTDDEGRFHYPGVPSGRYLMKVAGSEEYGATPFFAVPGQEVIVTPASDFGTRFEIRLPSGESPRSATIEFKRPRWKESQTRPWTSEVDRLEFPRKEFEVRVRIEEDDVRLSGDVSGTVSEWRRITFSDALKHVRFDLLPQPSILGRVEPNAARPHVKVTHVYAVAKGTIAPDLSDREVLTAMRDSDALNHSHDERSFAICPSPDGDVDLFVGLGDGTPKFVRIALRLSGGPQTLSVALDSLDGSAEMEARLEGLENKGFRAISFEARAMHRGAIRPIGCAAFMVGKSSYILSLDPRDIDALRADGWTLDVEIEASSARGDRAISRVAADSREVEFDFDPR